MQEKSVHAITGAFGFTGKYIAQRLLDQHIPVRTLTNTPAVRNPFGARIDIRPLVFEDRGELQRHLEGVQVFYNTYWVRFNHDSFNFATATRNLVALFEEARKAGVERIVHISITNPSLDSPYEYFRGKADVEQALMASGVSHAILRPAVLFGHEGLLFNNIAWLLRRFPLFLVFGRGTYRIRPIFVGDLAELAVAHALRRRNVILDAVGPQAFAYREWVRIIGRIIGKPRPVLPVPASLGYLAALGLGRMVKDVLLTKEEIAALMDDLLYVDSPTTGNTRFTDWATAHSHSLGRLYQSELRRRIHSDKTCDSI